MSREQEILSQVKALAAEYYELTGKPLGVTGEVAEYEAASKLGLELAPARTPGYDAVRPETGERVQIKGRRITAKTGRVPTIRLEHQFDTVVLVLLNEHYEAIEMLEAPYGAVKARLLKPGSRARNKRGQMAVSQFRSIATRVWAR